ncbi:MAG: hypothetical protein NTV70_01095 [Acidobacteria bacterium]|nr:hypothetical protein [Acidobacteriota bacterium]
MFTLVTAALSAGPLLEIPNAALVGNPGQRVGWGFRLTGDDQFWLVVSSVQSTFPDTGGYAGENPPVSDLLSPYFALSGLALKPLEVLELNYNGADLGLASYLIRPDAVPGLPDVGDLFITYDLYTDAPSNGGQQVFPTGDPGAFTIAASVGLQSVPEPGTGLLFLSALAVWPLWRFRRWAAPVVLLGIAAVPGHAQSCTQTGVPVVVSLGASNAALGDLTISCSVLSGRSVQVFLVFNTNVGDAGAATANGTKATANSVIPYSLNFSNVYSADGLIQISGLRVDSRSLPVGSPVSALAIITAGPDVYYPSFTGTLMGYVVPPGFTSISPMSCTSTGGLAVFAVGSPASPVPTISLRCENLIAQPMTLSLTTSLPLSATEASAASGVSTVAGTRSANPSLVTYPGVVASSTAADSITIAGVRLAVPGTPYLSVSGSLLAGIGTAFVPIAPPSVPLGYTTPPGIETISSSGCIAVSVPLALRREGKAEALGETFLYCPPGLPPLEIDAALNGPVVNAALSKAVGTATVSGQPIPSRPNAVHFSNVATTDFGVSITGLRVNASALTPTTAVLSSMVVTAGTALVPVNPNPVTLGYVLPDSATFSIQDRTAAAPAPPTGVAIKQCDGSNPAMATNPATGVPVGPTFHVRVAERFSFALRTRSSEGAGSASGTRVRLLFENVPAGVQIFAPVSVRAASMYGPGMEIRLIDHDSTLAGTSVLPLPELPPSNPAAGGLRPLRSMGGQTVMGIWEAVADNLYEVDTLNIPIYVVFPAGTTSPVAPRLTVSFAPVDPALSTVVPSFGGGSTFTPFRIEPCACGVTLLSRLVNKTGPLNARKWQVSLSNTGSADSVPATTVAFQIANQAGPGAATITGPATFSNSPIAKGAMRTFDLDLAFTGTTSASRFRLQGTATGGCLNTTFTIQNQVP